MVTVALDPYMFRRLPFGEVCRIAADIGYQAIELSPRDDMLPFFVHPRADRATMRQARSVLAATGLQVASVLPLYRWSSPDEDERQAAVRYWRRAIALAVELGCTTMNSELNGRPEDAARSEAQLWRSLDELLPVFEREGIRLHLEAHPDDFVEQNGPAVRLVRAIDSPMVGYLYCAPHTFHLAGASGQDVSTMVREAGPLLRHVHVADTFDHRASSGLRYILNPPGTPARIHQHLDVGQGEVDFDAFFGALREVGFDGIATACVFAWEERAVESSTAMLRHITAGLGLG